MTPTHVEPDRQAPGQAESAQPRRRAADVAAVMREQLDYLIEHTAGGLCGCPDCQRFERVRAELLRIFSD